MITVLIFIEVISKTLSAFMNLLGYTIMCFSKLRILQKNQHPDWMQFFENFYSFAKLIIHFWCHFYGSE
ncbi:hypothetical protein FFZ99_09660 [Leptospira interrogans]|nr:hypothetical protein IQ65_03935 [Leptospira interrogans serovar Lai]KYZ64005.1 hypothetical protein AWU66_17805 [Leptospira interrogans serovar Pomona]MCR8628602.1 hypothetical protein [Leptospira interrogans serovar Canicola]OQM27266.1 hypothetical protein DV38_20055 [Leptospira interrogans]OQM33553.1 hypothetical protein DV30_01535 [Leptospira interrogans serovar Canicola str. Gui44]